MIETDPEWDYLMRYDVDYLLKLSDDKVAKIVKEVKESIEKDRHGQQEE